MPASLLRSAVLFDVYRPRRSGLGKSTPQVALWLPEKRVWRCALTLGRDEASLTEAEIERPCRPWSRNWSPARVVAACAFDAGRCPSD